MSVPTTLTPAEVLEKAARDGKSIRQVIDELHPAASAGDRALLAKTVVCWAAIELISLGGTKEQLRELLGPLPTPPGTGSGTVAPAEREGHHDPDAKGHR
jgi:hypothetical protein